jgi:hypothetical protein
MSYTCHNSKHLVIYQINVYKIFTYFLIDIYPNKDGR